MASSSVHFFDHQWNAAASCSSCSSSSSSSSSSSFSSSSSSSFSSWPLLPLPPPPKRKRKRRKRKRRKRKRTLRSCRRTGLGQLYPHLVHWPGSSTKSWMSSERPNASAGEGFHPLVLQRRRTPAPSQPWVTGLTPSLRPHPDPPNPRCDPRRVG